LTSSDLWRIGFPRSVQLKRRSLVANII
jgi:hypothetical protein